MKNESLYHRTVDILVQAYFDDTLLHGNCFACAVGNIVAANCNLEFKPHPSFKLIWDKYSKVSETATYHCKEYDPYFTSQQIEDQVRATGYSIHELGLIEIAFESQVQPFNYRPYKGQTDDEAMFNGLMSVIECLDKIHENNDTKVTETSKRKFQKQI